MILEITPTDLREPRRLRGPDPASAGGALRPRLASRALWLFPRRAELAGPAALCSRVLIPECHAPPFHSVPFSARMSPPKTGLPRARDLGDSGLLYNSVPPHRASCFLAVAAGAWIPDAFASRLSVPPACRAHLCTSSSWKGHLGLRVPHKCWPIG